MTPYSSGSHRGPYGHQEPHRISKGPEGNDGKLGKSQ